MKKGLALVLLAAFCVMAFGAVSVIAEEGLPIETLSRARQVGSLASLIHPATDPANRRVQLARV